MSQLILRNRRSLNYIIKNNNLNRQTNLVNLNFQNRHLSTSHIYLKDKKPPKKDEDKEDDKKKDEQTQKINKQVEYYKEWWENLTSGGKILSGLLAAGLLLWMLPDSTPIFNNNSNSLMSSEEESNMQQLTHMIKNNQVKSLKWYKQDKILRVTDQYDRAFIIRNANNDTKDYIHGENGIYNNLNIPIEDRVYFEIVENGRNDKSNIFKTIHDSYFDYLFSNLLMTGAMIYFLIYKKNPNFKSPFTNMQSPFTNIQAGNAPKNVKKGKKGKKGGGGGGIFGQMQPDSDIGDLVEPNEIDV